MHEDFARFFLQNLHCIISPKGPEGMASLRSRRLALGGSSLSLVPSQLHRLDTSLTPSCQAKPELPGIVMAVAAGKPSPWPNLIVKAVPPPDASVRGTPEAPNNIAPVFTWRLGMVRSPCRGTEALLWNRAQGYEGSPSMQLQHELVEAQWYFSLPHARSS